MVDNSKFAWHMQYDLCLVYDVMKYIHLKMILVNGSKCNLEIAVVF